MKRLTEKNDVGSYYFPKCFEKYNGLGASSKCDNCENMTNACEKLGAYEDAEEQGLLLRLPISEDAPVYSIEYCCERNKSNRSGKCFRGFCENCSDKAYYIRESVAKHCNICEINKSVFFTREEAEAKLKEMEGESDVL